MLDRVKKTDEVRLDSHSSVLAHQDKDSGRKHSLISVQHIYQNDSELYL